MVAAAPARSKRAGAAPERTESDTVRFGGKVVANLVTNKCHASSNKCLTSDKKLLELDLS